MLSKRKIRGHREKRVGEREKIRERESRRKRGTERSERDSQNFCLLG